MSSGEEDDVHQCGRCKAVFHSIDEYFNHKKTKSCQKKKKSSQRVRLFEDVHDEGNSRERDTLNTPKYVPTSGLYDSLLEFVGINTNDGFSNDGISKDGLSQKSNSFMCFNFEDSKDVPDVERQQQKGAKRKNMSPPTTQIDKRQKGRPKKAGEVVCTICDFKALYQKDMDTHMLVEHKINRYTCQHCQANFKSKGHLNEHLLVCFLKTGKTSNLGGSATTTQKGYNQGLLDENANFKATNFECQDCGKLLASFDELSNHVKEEHKEISPGICRFCGRWFPTKNQIFRHLTTSTHPEISESDMKAERSDISHLKIHWKVPRHQSGIMEFRCKKCHIDFENKQNLMAHNQNQHATEKNYSCENCGESFRTQRQYLSHLNSHGIQPFEPGFKCPTCAKQFNQKIHVCRHIETLHTPVQQVPDEMLSQIEPELQDDDDDDDEIYTCFVCRKQLVSQAKLLKHIQLHRVWCVNTPEGPQAEGIDHLFEKLSDPKLPGVNIDLNKPSFAVLLGMKPIQDGVGIPIVNPTRCEDDNIKNSDKNISDEQPQKDSNNESMRLNQTSSGDAQPAIQVLPSMPLDLTCTFDPRENIAKSNDKATDGQTVVHGAPNNITQTVTDSRVPDLRSPTPDSQQCSTIDQSALRDLVEALETISGTDLEGPGNENAADESLPSVNQDLPTPILEIAEDSSSSVPALDQSENATDDTEVHSHENSQSNIVCPYCLKTFATLMESYLHKVNEHQLLPVFKCLHPTCKSIFQTVTEYENHSLEHSQRSFICRICNEHFNELQQMVAHKSSAHRSIKNLDYNSTTKSVVQGKTVSEASQSVSVSSGIERTFLCDKCGVTFTSKAMLSRHKLHHTRDNDLKCQECSAVFKHKEHLRRHEKSKHSNEKPFRCTYEGCDRAFSRKDKLKVHGKVHADAQYVCQYCSKAYHFKDGLRNHELTHQKELKYFCTMCDGAFCKPAMLRAHMSVAHQISLKKNSYPCHQCGKVFNRPERLKRHMEREHQVATTWKFNCDLCRKGFAGKNSYSTHMKQRHAGFVEDKIEPYEVDEIDQNDIAKVPRTPHSVYSDGYHHGEQASYIFVPVTSGVDCKLVMAGNPGLTVPVPLRAVSQLSPGRSNVPFAADIQSNTANNHSIVSVSAPGTQGILTQSKLMAPIPSFRPSSDSVLLLHSVSNVSNTHSSVPIQMMASPSSTYIPLAGHHSSQPISAATRFVISSSVSGIPGSSNVLCSSSGSQDEIHLRRNPNSADDILHIANTSPRTAPLQIVSPNRVTTSEMNNLTSPSTDVAGSQGPLWSNQW